MYAVFNSANKGSAIEATGPCLRILANNLTLNAAMDFVQKPSLRSTETRTWPMSKASKYEVNIKWRSISSVNLLELSDAERATVLDKEYGTFEQRIRDWTALREQMCKDVFEASQSKHRRPYHQLIAERLLDFFGSKVGPKSAKETASDSAESNYNVFELLPSDEVRGQTWAIIAIMGDARYETEREKILDALGLQYFEQSKELLLSRNEYNCELLDVNDPKVQDYINSKVDFEDSYIQHFAKDIAIEAKQNLDKLIKEPLVAFLGSSDDASELLKQTNEMSQHESLKHADIAVVRMYSWLKLSSITMSKNRIARDPKAQDFFSKLR